MPAFFACWALRWHTKNTYINAPAKGVMRDSEFVEEPDTIRVIFAGILHIVLIGYFGSVVYKLRTYLWVKVDGIVTHWEIEKYDDEGENFRPKIEYTYSFDGNEYKGETLSYFVQGTAERNDAVEFLWNYEVGDPSAIYVCESNPQLSVLERGLNRHAIIEMIVVGMIWVFFGQPYVKYQVSHILEIIGS